MLDSRPLWTLATAFPRIFRGSTLHHAGLAALHRGDYAAAQRLLAAAGGCYRREIAVEALARLRVHELIARVRSQPHPERETEMCLEVERRMALLDRIESLDPPFALVLARTLLANWLSVAGPAQPASRDMLHAA